jgi:hypothetical protein
MATPPKIFIKADGNTGKAHGSDGTWEAPHLSEALFKAPAGAADDYRTQLEKGVNLPKDKGGMDPVKLEAQDPAAFKAELNKLFGHILERLKGSLDEAWMSVHGYNPSSDDFKKLVVSARKAGKNVSDPAVLGSASSDVVEAAKFYDSGEEQWARAFTEILVGNMYHTPGQLYGGKDVDWYNRFPQVYSIAMACQTLSTYCCLSRGFALGPGWPGGLSCSKDSAAAQSAMKKPDSRQIKPMIGSDGMKAQLKAQNQITDDTPPDEVKQKVDAALAAPGAQLYSPAFSNVKTMVEWGALPGSVVVFNEHGSDSRDQTPIKPKSGGVIHIASALRVEGKRIQFADTGVVVGKGESFAGEAGTMDHRFSEGALTHSESLVALGIAQDAAEATLVKGAGDMAKALPVGVARLVVYAADRNQILFVSKLLAMRWPVSKLIWSLRANASPAPYTGLTLAWLLWTPKADGATKLADALTPGAKVAPATLITGNLTLTHVLVSDGNTVKLARNHTSSSWDHSDLALTVRRWKLADDTPLIDLPPGLNAPAKPPGWCERPENFDQSYTRTMDPKDTGKIGKDPMGHELVDP